jgi:hypothetical protein
MSTSAEINAKVKDLMAKGDIAGARAALEEKASDAPVNEAAAAAAAAPKEPRKFDEVVLDLFKSFHNLLGTNPAQTALISELHTIVTGETPPPKS